MRLLIQSIAYLTILLLTSSPAICQAKVYQFADNGLGDIIAIYYGQKGRENWNVSDITNAVIHKYSDGHTDWLFPTFLFLEFRRNNKMFGNGHPVAKIPSEKEDWEWLINRFFTPNEALDALDKSIEQCKSILGNPHFKHHVILTIPVPVDGQDYWGRIGTKRISFKKDTDKLEAIEWYVSEIERLFLLHNYKNIELIGFHWLDEQTKYSGSYVNQVGKMLHKKNYKFIIVPMNKAVGRFEWKQNQFDYCYLQSGYFWKPQQNKTLLYNTIDIAKTYGMGLEFEINEKLFGENHSLYLSRMKDVIDVFEDKGVFSNSGILYYFSNRALLQLSASRNKEDIAIFDRLASLISQRNQHLPSISPSNTNTNTKDVLDWRDPEYWHF